MPIVALMHIILIILVALASIYKTFNFYFWHDDFSVLYGAATDQCLFKWPYKSYCGTFSFLYKLFGLNASAYFLLGEVLFLGLIIVFYLLAKKLYDKNTALLGTLLFSSVYLGAGVFLESYDSITIFLSTGLYLISLLLLHKAIYKEFKLRQFILSVTFLSFSTVVLHARSTTYLFPFLVFIFLFAGKIKLKTKIFASLFSGIVYFFFLRLGTSNEEANGLISLSKFILETNVFLEVKELLQNLSLFVLTDSIVKVIPVGIISMLKIDNIRLTVGLLLAFIFLTVTYMSNKLKDVKYKQSLLLRKNQNITSYKAMIFAGSIFFFFYLPYALRSDGVWASTNRYVWPVFIGMCFLWMGILNNRFTKVLTIFLIFLGVIQTNAYFKTYYKEGLKRQKFYSQLLFSRPAIEKGTIFYFDYPSSIAGTFIDYFRVGYLPSEASLATYYKLLHKDIKLITDPNELINLLKTGEINKAKIISFYYDGEHITDSTVDFVNAISSQNTLTYLVHKNTGTVFKSLDSANVGSTKDLEFNLNNFEPIAPYEINFTVKASAQNVKLPYKQECVGCSQIYFDSTYYHRYLSESRLIKQVVSIKASTSGENTIAQNLIDYDKSTYWTGNRQTWYSGQKPTIAIHFANSTTISGLAIRASYESRIPKEFEIYIDGKKVENKVFLYPNWTKITFGSQYAANIEIKITETKGGDVPTIETITFIPANFQEVDLTKLDLIRDNPAGSISTMEEKNALMDHMSYGVDACLIGEVSGYIDKIKKFNLIADNQVRTYKLIMPPMGPNKPIFKISCLNYPIKVYLEYVSVNFLGNNEN